MNIKTLSFAKSAKLNEPLKGSDASNGNDKVSQRTKKGSKILLCYI